MTTSPSTERVDSRKSLYDMYSVYGSTCSRIGIADYIGKMSTPRTAQQRKNTHIGILGSKHHNLIELRQITDKIIDPGALHRPPPVFPLRANQS